MLSHYPAPGISDVCIRRAAGILLTSLALSLSTEVETVAADHKIVPLVRAHSHNDYDQARPLMEALDNGFCSVEADIHLVDGKLLVAHDRSKVKPENTLESMYLEPLRQRAKANDGKIYPGGPTVTLMIDPKSEAEPTYEVLHKVLEQYSDIVTEFNGDKVTERALLVVISGNRPSESLPRQNRRFATLDGLLTDLDANNKPASLMPWISTSWRPTFKWNGTGTMPEDEKKKLRELVNKAHQQHRRIRFWGAPDQPTFWSELYAADVDLLNTDHLSRMKDFLLSKQK